MPVFTANVYRALFCGLVFIFASAFSTDASNLTLESQLPQLSAETAAAPGRIVIVLFPVKEAVVASVVPANVEEYKFKEGEAFFKGDLIVQMDSRQYEQVNAKAEALYEESKAAVAFAERNFSRLEKLFAKSAIGMQELEQGKLDLDIAKAKMKSAESEYKMAALNLAACSQKAPFNGRLTRRIAKVHEFVNAGQPLMEIIDDSVLLAGMHIPSSMYKNIKVGDELDFKVNETGTVCKGKVCEISGRIDYESRTFGVKATIDNKDRKLLAGMSGYLVEKEGR